MKINQRPSCGGQSVEESGHGNHPALFRFFRHRRTTIGLILLFLLIILAVFAPVVAGQDPYAMTSDFGAEPSAGHPLGTDMMGRDLFSRLIYASRISLAVGIGTTLISVTIGLALGLLAGYLGGMADAAVMRLVDVLMTFPPMILLLVIVGVVGPGLFNIIVVLGLLGWTHLARLVRGSVLSVKETNFVKAAKMTGYSSRGILLRQILPNIMGPVLVNATFKIAASIVTEASLSFLGLGVQPPTASWGNMLSDAKSLTVLTSMPWMWVPPSVMILLTVMAFHFVGEGLRDALDPYTETE